MMRMLVSVRDVAEARIAARGGADFIDLKEPRDGALGGLPIDAIAQVVQALQEQGSPLPISATIGDLPMNDLPAILARVEAVAACGVDYVKVGIEREVAAGAVLDALAATGHRIIPVFIADRGLDFEQVAHACALKFPGMMVDTADKPAGSLFDLVSGADLRRFVARVRASGALVGLAGALRHAQLPALQQLAPDFAGFRSAVCAGDRSGALDPERLRELAARLHAAPAPVSA
ncbi:(5-formylfuran-3-yl)methyl phosphate synthase [Ideonella sp.]|uniref:(5-formylfuran-3-yl)methyl phosphate synthase n=1 Tax=Ideonella sp. TaxID=1929293 RepID=UPI00351BAA35